MNEAFTTEHEFLVGMHFEIPKPPAVLEGIPLPHRHFCPDGNFVGAQILRCWINDKLEHGGLLVARGAVWGELNNCSGRWIVSNAEQALRLMQSAVYSFLPGADRNPFHPTLELGWFDSGARIYRLWRPAESDADFGRHFTPEAIERGQCELSQVKARTEDDLRVINEAAQRIIASTAATSRNEQPGESERGNAS